ncbi:MAG: type 4a pilus biogenesis protein PilO [Gammaproteobacteria bacterium]|jgi:Tfp pilus assembly protein PilO
MAKTLIILFVDILFFILLYFLLIMPRLESLHFMRAKEERLKQSYVQSYRKVQQLTLLKQQLGKLDKINNKAKTFVFRRQSIVMHTIADIAQQFNIQVESIKFKEKYQIGKLCLYPILINFDGNHEDLQAFTAVLSEHFLLTGVQLTRKQNNYFGCLNLVLIA